MHRCHQFCNHDSSRMFIVHAFNDHYFINNTSIWVLPCWWCMALQYSGHQYSKLFINIPMCMSLQCCQLWCWKVHFHLGDSWFDDASFGVSSGVWKAQTVWVSQVLCSIVGLVAWWWWGRSSMYTSFFCMCITYKLNHVMWSSW